MPSIYSNLASCFCASLLLLILAQPAFPQRWEVGAGAGFTNYKGDLAPEVKLANTAVGANLNVRYNASFPLSFRGNIALLTMRADDANSTDVFLQNRGYEFQSTNIELSGLLEYNFFDFGRDKKVMRYTPFLFAGLGGTLMNITTGGNAPENDGTVILPSLPFGIGIKQLITDRISLVWEFKTVKTFSDRVDGVLDADMGPKLQRVSRLDFDTYYFLGATLTFRFLELNCPPYFERMQERQSRKKRPGRKKR